MASFEVFSDNSSDIDKLISKFRGKLNDCNDWDKLISLIAEFEIELKEVKNVKRAQKYFATKIDFDRANIIQKIYTKEDGKFYERVIKFEMDFNSLPKELKNKLNNLHEEININEIVKKELNISSVADYNLNDL